MQGSARASGGYETSNLALQQVCGAYRVECDRWWDFRGDVRTKRIGSLDLAEITFSACTVIRDHRDEHYRGDQYFLVLFGTGIRPSGGGGGSTVTATIGGRSVTVLYAGPQGNLAGLDQINLSITNIFGVSGETPVTLTADGKTAGNVVVAFP